MKVARGLQVPGQGAPHPLFFLFRPEGGRASRIVRPPSGETTKGSFGGCLPGTEVPGKNRPPSGRKSRNPTRASPSAPRAVKAIDVLTPRLRLGF